MLILQEAFRKNGYIDLLPLGAASSEFGIDLDDIFDSDKQPEELCGLYISNQRDDLFFLLYGDSEKISSICDQWDDRIRVFTLINGKAEPVRKLKYNIVQLLIYSGETPDRSREANLQISRKIIIKGEKTAGGGIIIDDEEAIELPFHMIPADAFAPDEAQMTRLRQLLPEDEKVLKVLKKPPKKVYGKEKDGVLDKSFATKDYETIRGWLEG